ncbi:MAG: histidine phosphatase family protein [Halorubrum sp.]
MADVVWIVRHGERRDSVDPDWETHADRVHDPPLTELGRWAAWRVGRRFATADRTLDAVYASPFLRTVETAVEICRETDHEVLLEPGLGEHRNPDWFESDPETVPIDALADRFDPVRPARDSGVVPAFPETHAEAMDRIGEAARRLVAARDGALLFVGHGVTVGGVVRGLTGSAASVEAPLCGLTRLDRLGDAWELSFSGETSHLDSD